MQRRYGHLVIQFETDNPGAWSYHCHIAWHASMGLNIGILEGAAEVRENRKEIERVVGGETCRKWEAWSKVNEVTQIDAGI